MIGAVLLFCVAPLPYLVNFTKYWTRNDHRFTALRLSDGAISVFIDLHSQSSQQSSATLGAKSTSLFQSKYVRFFDKTLEDIDRARINLNRKVGDEETDRLIIIEAQTRISTRTAGLDRLRTQIVDDSLACAKNRATLGFYGEASSVDGFKLIARIPSYVCAAPLMFLGVHWAVKLFKNRRLSERMIPCLKCAYELMGNSSGICPECGELVSPEQMEQIHAVSGMRNAKEP